MNPVYAEQRLQRKKEAEIFHEKMAQLFKDNRFLFEIERKKLIEEIINSQKDEHRKQLLQNSQKKLDKILNNAGSKYNRLVLMRMLLFDMFYDSFRPLVNSLGDINKNRY